MMWITTEIMDFLHQKKNLEGLQAVKKGLWCRPRTLAQEIIFLCLGTAGKKLGDGISG